MSSYVAQSLLAEVANELCDLIYEIPTSDLYIIHKTTISHRMGLTDQ